MAIVRITKNDKILRVSESSFKNYYKDFGWSVILTEPAKEDNKIIEEKEEETIESQYNEVVNSSDEDWDSIDEEIDRPLSEMNKEELKALAERKGIDVSNINKVGQLRSILAKEI